LTIGAEVSGGRELFVRHARREGKSVAIMAMRAGPYTFADARQATAFVTEAVEALMYLGCDVQAA
jgi:hypothetical protein